MFATQNRACWKLAFQQNDRRLNATHDTSVTGDSMPRTTRAAQPTKRREMPKTEHKRKLTARQDFAGTKFVELAGLELERRCLSRELAEIEYKHLLLRLEIDSLGLQPP